VAARQSAREVLTLSRQLAVNFAVMHNRRRPAKVIASARPEVSAGWEAHEAAGMPCPQV
jgi:hypothetical protein